MKGPLHYSPPCESGGIGRRARLRISWGLAPWGFESPLSHGCCSLENAPQRLQTANGGAFSIFYRSVRTSQCSSGQSQKRSRRHTRVKDQAPGARRVTADTMTSERRYGTRPILQKSKERLRARQSHQHRKDFHCRSKLALEPIRSTDWDFSYNRMGSESSSERRWGCFCEQRMP